MHMLHMLNAYNLLTHSDHKNLLIVFDGYGQSSTKDHARVQRSPITSLEIVFHEGTIFDSKKYVFCQMILTSKGL